jgi:hypothetical protein
VVFEGRELVDNHHIVVKGKAGLVDQPLQVLTVDNRDIRILHQRRLSLLGSPDCDRIGQTRKVTPFLDFRRPCITGDS